MTMNPPKTLADPKTTATNPSACARVLDASASMQVQEAGGTRFALARRKLDGLVGSLPDGAPVLLVAAADRPRVVLRWSADRQRLATATTMPDDGWMDNNNIFTMDWFPMVPATVQLSGAADLSDGSRMDNGCVGAVDRIAVVVATMQLHTSAILSDWV